MEAKEAQTLERQRQRRNRINRMKTGIIVGIAGWIVVSLLAIIFLTVQVARLSQQVEKLQGQAVDRGEPAVQTQAPETQQTTEQGSEVSSEQQIVTGIDTADNIAEEGDTHKVYLTFDGGPNENTEKILDVLKEYEVKATFFVTGDSSEEMEEVYRRIVDEGHTLGMHSYSNQYSTIYASTEAFTEDFDKLSDYLEEVTGVKSLYYRFPGGSSNEISNVSMAEFVRILNEKGITYFDWNVSAGDTSSDYTAADVVANVTEGISKYKTSVVLLHDDEDKSETVEALGPLIEALRAQDAEILPIDEDTKVIQYIKADSVE